MRRYWNNFTDEIGKLIVDVALGHAQAAAARGSETRFVDTGLTPDDLYRQCLATLVDGWEQESASDSWQPLAMWAADTRFQQGMFRFLLKVEEALGHLAVVQDDEGKPRVAVSRELVSGHCSAHPRLAQAGPAC